MEVRNRVDKFEMESFEPHCVVHSHEVKQYDASFLACLKCVLDVLGEEGYFVCGRPPMAEAGLFFFGSLWSMTRSRQA